MVMGCGCSYSQRAFHPALPRNASAETFEIVLARRAHRFSFRAAATGRLTDKTFFARAASLAGFRQRARAFSRATLRASFALFARRARFTGLHVRRASTAQTQPARAFGMGELGGILARERDEHVRRSAAREAVRVRRRAFSNARRSDAVTRLTVRALERRTAFLARCERSVNDALTFGWKRWRKGPHPIASGERSRERGDASIDVRRCDVHRLRRDRSAEGLRTERTDIRRRRSGRGGAATFATSIFLRLVERAAQALREWIRRCVRIDRLHVVFFAVRIDARVDWGS